MISYKDIETQTGWHPGVTVKRRYLYICSAFMVSMMVATAPPDMWREGEARRLDGKR